MAIKRRDFLKALSSAIGGAIVLSCGSNGNDSGNNTASPVIPNGFQFFKIVTTGDALPGGTAVKALSGEVKLSDYNDLIFTATCDDDVLRIFEFHLDFSTGSPAVTQTRKLVGVGDTLPDGTLVGEPLMIGSPNRLGNYATVITNAAGILGVYLERDKNGLRPAVLPLDDLPGGIGKYGAGFGDLELDDNDALLLVSHFSPAQSAQPQEGLFYLPGGSTNGDGRLVASTGTLMPDSNTMISRFGLVDLSKTGGEYVTQITPSVSVAKSAAKAVTATGLPPTAIMGGSVLKTTAKLRAASGNLPRALYSGSLSGDSLYAPRLGGQPTQVAQVLHTNTNQLSLHLNNQVVAYTGSLSPMGRVVASFSGPLISDGGLLYYLCYTADGEELCVFNGADTKTILEMGQRAIEGENRAVMDINFGIHRNMVDKDGRVVFLGVLEDQTRAIIIGIPV